MITIQIGNFRRDYIVLETNAPKAYDYGTTLTIFVDLMPEKLVLKNESETVRIIIVPSDKVDYQIGRNSSGLYSTAEINGDLENFVNDRMVERYFNWMTV